MGNSISVGIIAGAAMAAQRQNADDSNTSSHDCTAKDAACLLVPIVAAAFYAALIPVNFGIACLGMCVLSRLNDQGLPTRNDVDLYAIAGFYSIAFACLPAFLIGLHIATRSEEEEREDTDLRKIAGIVFLASIVFYFCGVCVAADYLRQSDRGRYQATLANYPMGLLILMVLPLMVIGLKIALPACVRAVRSCLSTTEEINHVHFWRSPSLSIQIDQVAGNQVPGPSEVQTPSSEDSVSSVP